MKKLLAMVLALVMTLSLAVSANAAFKDADKVSASYEEAVAVLNGMGVFQGYEDGSFQPQGDITRAEVATIIYRIYTQDISKNDKSGLYASYNKFSDMTGAGWAAGYIGYCANAEFVKGYPDGTFKPSGKVTGYEVLTMILRAIGYDKNGEFTGADWAVNVAKYAEQAGVLENVKGVSLSAPATRELVAELLFRAIAKAPMVTYTAAFGYQTVSFNGSKEDSKLFKDNETLGHKNFDLTDKPTNGTYGRPATKWTYNCGDKSTTVYDKPVATYTEEFKPCDLCKDLSKKKEAKVTVAYVDGVDTSAAAKAYVDTFKATDTKTALGAQGQLVEVYENEKGEDYTVIVINTYLAKVTKVIEEVKDKNDHVRVEASVNVYVYGTKVDKDGAVTAEAVTGNFETTGFAKNDYVLVTYDDGDIASMEAAKSESAKLSGIKAMGNTISDVQKITGIGYADATVAVKATLNPMAKEKTTEVKLGTSYTFYYDSYNNVIGVGDYNADAEHVVIDKIWADHPDGDGTVYANLVPVSDANAPITKVEVTKINDKDVEKLAISTDAKKNSEYYYDLATYTVDKNGKYELDTTAGIPVAKTVKDDKNNETLKYFLCSYDESEKADVIYTFDSEEGNIYLDKDTEFLFQYDKSPAGTFKSFTFDNLPKSFWGYVEYVVDADNGRADVVYIRGAEETFSYVFVTDVEPLKHNDNGDGTTTYTLDAYYLDANGKMDESEKNLVTVASGSDKFVIENPYTSAQAFSELTKAGLYKLYTLGENNQLLEYVEPTQLKDVKDFNNTPVIGLYDGETVDTDVTNNYFWTGKLADKDVPSSAKLETVEDSNDKEFNVGDYVFAQRDSDDKIVGLHKVSFEVSVNKEYNGTEYYGTAFEPIKVALKEQEVIKDAKMGSTDLIVTYYNDKNEVVELDGTNSVKVSYAIISYTGTVTGNITYKVQDQSLFTSTLLKENTAGYMFTNQSQSAKVANSVNADTKINGTITVDAKNTTVTAKNLVTLLTEKAKGVDAQTIVGVYNTQDDGTLVADGDQLANDMLVKVMAWDGKTFAYYTITVENAPSK